MMMLVFVVSLYSVAGALIVVTALRSHSHAASYAASVLILLSVALVYYLFRRLKRLGALRRQAAAEGPEQCAQFLIDHHSEKMVSFSYGGY